MDKFVYSLIMLILAIPYSWAGETRALGIILKFKAPLNSAQIKELQGLYQKHGLTLEKRLEHYDVLERKNASENELQNLCKNKLKHASIKKCFMNREATLDQNEKNTALNFYQEELCYIDGTITQNKGPLANFLEKQKSCNLVQQLPDFKTSYNDEKKTLAEDVLGRKLSPLWAQEYIGSDLAKELVGQNKSSIFSPNIVILDRGFNSEVFEDYTLTSSSWADSTKDSSHGIQVMKLLSSPYPTSASNNGRIRYIHTINKTSDYLIAEEDINKKFVQPKLINVSMAGWDDETCETFTRLQKKYNSIGVVSAGNDFPKTMEMPKRCSSIITVGSLNPIGLSSSFSSEDETLTIAAPSDFYLSTRSNNFEKYQAFGGTSGAAPLVSGTLNNVMAFLPYLTTEQAKKMLSRSALPTLNAYDPKRKNGYGMVNAYKMTYLAKEIRDRCKNQTDPRACENDLIMENKTYLLEQQNSERSDLYDKMRLAYPACVPESIKTQFLSCEDRKKILDEVRKAAFLYHHDKRLWEWLSCVYKDQGYEVNAEFYWLIAHPSESAYLSNKKEANREITATLSFQLQSSAKEKPFHLSIPVDTAQKMKKTIEIAPDEALSYLKKEAKNPDPKIRAQSLLIMAQLFSEADTGLFKRIPSLAILEEAQNDKDPNIRELVANLAILHLPEDNSLTFLKHLIHDKGIPSIQNDQLLEKKAFKFLTTEEKQKFFQKVIYGKNREQQEAYTLEAARLLKQDSAQFIKDLAYTQRPALIDKAADYLPPDEAINFIIRSNQQKNETRLTYSKSSMKDEFLPELIRHYKLNPQEREIITELSQGLTPEAQIKFKKAIEKNK